METRYVAIDLETSGLSYSKGGRVIEIGTVAIEGAVITAEFTSPFHVWNLFPACAGMERCVSIKMEFGSGTSIKHTG
jgi:hypothetical protein